MAEEESLWENATFFKNNPDSREVLDEIVNAELKKYDNKSTPGKICSATYDVAKYVARSALIGAAVNGLPAGTYEGALEGAKQGALVAVPLVGIASVLVYCLRSKEENKKVEQRDRRTNIYTHENPGKMSLLFGALSSTCYLVSAIAVDVVAGTNISYWTAAKVGSIDGIYLAIKSVYKGKKLKEKITQELESLREINLAHSLAVTEAPYTKK